MSNSANKSATAPRAKLAKAKPASVSAAIANLLPPQPASVAKPTDAKPTVYVDQGVVDAFLNAEANVVETAIALFYACTVHAVSPEQFKGRSDAKVRASEFNCARKVAELGKSTAAARAIIAKAAAEPGDRRHNVLAALRAAKAAYKEVTPTALKGAALTRKVAAQAAEASKVASIADAKRKADKRATRVPKLPDTGTLAAFMPPALAALVDVQKRFGALSIPRGKLRAAENFADSLAETIKLAGELNG